MLGAFAAFCYFFACTFVSAKEPYEPRPCKGEPQYEAFVQIVNSEGKESGRSGLIEGKMSYDAENERIAIVGGNYYRGLHIRMLYLYNPSRAYVIFLSNNTCKSNDMIFPFPPGGVPSNASFFDNYLLGSLPHAFRVDAWRYVYRSHYKSEEGVMQTWSGHFTDEGCIPIHYSIFKGDLSLPLGEREETLELFSIHFGNYTSGIEDHSVFDVPEDCPQKKV